MTGFCYGQTYEKYSAFTLKQLDNNKVKLPKYGSYFSILISKRDTAYLRAKLNETDATRIYLIEGYNFETEQYSLFEEYKLDSKTFSYPGNNSFYLDKKILNMYTDYFLYDTTSVLEDKALTDTIFPRKYRYGAGCIVTKMTSDIFNQQRQKAINDGVVAEKYCRIETLIDKTTNKIIVKYFFPVRGQREFESEGVGQGTDWPAGLDFWLFASPYIID